MRVAARWMRSGHERKTERAASLATILRRATLAALTGTALTRCGGTTITERVVVDRGGDGGKLGPDAAVVVDATTGVRTRPRKDAGAASEPAVPPRADALVDARTSLDATSPRPDSAFADAASIAGNYDVWLDAPSLPAGCTIALGATHMNLSLRDEHGTLHARVFADYDWWLNDDAVSESDAALGISPLGRPDESRPVLSLYWDRTRFSGTGAARVPLACDDGTSRVALTTLRIGPDVTPPKIRLSPLTGFPETFPFTGFDIGFSEPLDTPNPDFPTFETTDAAIGARGLVDATTLAPIPFTSHLNWEGPGVFAIFPQDSRDAVVGKSVRLGGDRGGAQAGSEATYDRAGRRDSRQRTGPARGAGHGIQRLRRADHLRTDAWHLDEFDLLIATTALNAVPAGELGFTLATRGAARGGSNASVTIASMLLPTGRSIAKLRRDLRTQLPK